MKLTDYFERIGYSGPATPDLATLEGVTRAHVASVPFENLDVQLGRRLDTAIPAIFDKIVGQRRGGWCFEQNGLLGWALGEMGFDVRRLSGGVMRAERGDVALGNHLALRVMLEDRPWLVDAGFGGSLARPVPLAAGQHCHAPFHVSLAMLDDGHWRFSEWTDPATPFSFDFTDGLADEALLAARCVELQDDPESLFVQNLVAQRRVGDRHLVLRGRMLGERAPQGETRRMIDSAGELVAVLGDVFGIALPEAAGLWDKVRARHAELFPDEAAVPGA